MTHPQTPRAAALDTSRRDFLRRLSLLLGGTAVSGPVAAGLVARFESAASVQAAEAAPFLNQDEKGLVKDLAECILPRTDTPGAADAGVDAFIDEIVGGYFKAEDQFLYKSGLKRLDRRALERFGSSFANCETAQQNTLVRDLDRHTFAEPSGERTDLELGDDDARFFRFHKELTVAGFYTSEVGQTQELRKRRFGPFRGDVELLEGQKAWV